MPASSLLPRRRGLGSSRDLLLVLMLALLLFGASVLMISVATPKGHAASDGAADAVAAAAGGEPEDPLDGLLEDPARAEASSLKNPRTLRRRDRAAGKASKGDDSWESVGGGEGGVALDDAGAWAGEGDDAWGARRDEPAKGAQSVGQQQQQQRRGAAGKRSAAVGGVAGGEDTASRSEAAGLREEVAELRGQLAVARAQLAAAARKAKEVDSQAAVRGGGAGAGGPAPSCAPAPGAHGGATRPGGGYRPPRPSPKPFMPSSNGRALLRSWRSRSLDWHDLVRPVKPMSDGDAAGEYRTKLLVGGELDAISYLQGFLGLRVAGDSGGEEGGGGGDPFDVSAHYAGTGDWGPLAKYGGCPVLRDKCMVHGSDRECALDELCGWCASSLTCVDRMTRMRPEKVTGAEVPVCPHPLLVLRASVDAQSGALPPGTIGKVRGLTQSGTLGGEVDMGSCGVVVTRNRPVHVSITGNAKMAYHFFTENAAGIHAGFQGAGATSDLASHVWVAPDSTPEFIELMHAYTDSCYRWSYEIPGGSDGDKGGVCYTGTKLHGDGQPVALALWDSATRAPAPDSAWESHPSLAPYKPPAGGKQGGGDGPGVTPEGDAIALGHRLGLDGMARWLKASGSEKEAQALVTDGSASMPSFLVASLGLWDVQPTGPHVTLISRRNKRLILNEPELVAAVAPLGVPVEVASLETMTLYEQMALFRRTTVLAGIHGSGLINSIFMHPGTALVQLMPYNVQAGASFFAGPAASAGVAYFEWTNPKRENTVHHWHFLGADHAGDRDELVACGSNCGGPDIYFSFHINQDTWVDEGDWVEVLRQALTQSDVNKRLYRAVG